MAELNVCFWERNPDGVLHLLKHFIYKTKFNNRLSFLKVDLTATVGHVSTVGLQPNILYSLTHYT